MGSVCIHLNFSVWIISHTMKEFCSFLCLLLVLPGSLSECDFRDETLFDGTFNYEETIWDNDHSGEGDHGVFVYRKLNIWQNHIVNFMFDPSMSYRDIEKVREILFPVLRIYQRKTCIKFWYHQNNKTIPEHHLIIKGRFYKFEQTRCRWGGNVRRLDTNMVMNLRIPSGDHCLQAAEALIYHEMGHAFGIMHTQKRLDRDNYVIFDENCVKPTKRALYQFEHIPERSLYVQLDYECDSIMHYRKNTYKRKFESCERNSCRCNVLSPVPGSTCKAINPSPVPTKLDWKLINMVQNCPGF